ncbi:hypothetical protein SLEP1_g54515 [Rubroshorea leprosula]|uniref:Uncharacterized protein n=1 Tax=Rubroshorea leprosula TaxID=152421 RepID=A0AAV5MCN0_9ROSI|nr:hypothetical protein SLEP1_g54515 [Rubroshorea leprosula]
MGFWLRSIELLFVFWVVLRPFCLGIWLINSRLSVDGGDEFGFSVYGAFEFVEAPQYQNGNDCLAIKPYASLCDPSFVHIVMTLDSEYLRGSLVAMYSINHHASCPKNIFFHFITVEFNSASPWLLNQIVRSTFLSLKFKVHIFKEDKVINLISSSIHEALGNPLIC